MISAREPWAGRWARPPGPRRTSGWLALVSCLTVFADCAAPLAQPATLIGTWEYRQANSARPTGLDREGERLVFLRAAGGQVVALFFGLERAGEAGLFYTAVEATGLKVDPNGTVRLTVPTRRLFRKRPKSLEEATKLEPAGSTTFELSLSGRLTEENLVMTCLAGGDSCPNSRMVFRRLSPRAQ